MCLVCQTAVTEDVNGIECYDCKEWAHFKCSKLSRKHFELLVESDNSIQWHCPTCQKGEEERKGKTEAKIDFLISQFTEMKETIVRLESGYTGTTLDEKIEKVVERKLAEALDERTEKEKRKCNVILVGLKESEEDTQTKRDKDDMTRIKEMMKKIDETLNDETVSDTVRLGKKTQDRPRLLKFKVRDETVKDKILKNYYTLNKNKPKPEDRVYFNPDYTPLQREQHRQLRAELQDRVTKGETDLVIRSGKIVKRTKPAGAGGKAPAAADAGQASHAQAAVEKE